MSAYSQETVLSVHHWTDSLFSFKATRDPSFRFQNGQFTMIGLMVDGKPLVRAYSMASTNYDEELEFLSIKVPHGPLTSRLQNIKVGDQILVGRKPVGTLLLSNLLPGKRLYLLSTGTGLAPFMSVIRDLEVYEQFEKVVLIHGCRRVSELAYMGRITEELPKDEYLGEFIREKLIYYPLVTREPFENQGRVTDLIESGKLAERLNLPEINPEEDRVMLCGSPEMLADSVRILESRGFDEGSGSKPGHYVIEKAFVEK